MLEGAEGRLGLPPRHTSADHICMNGLLARAVLAFLALPGTVAFLIPWLLVEPRRSGQFVDARGLVPFVLGTVLLLWCVREFYVAGRGTLAPRSPPRHLVATGLYRFSRNPMYIAVVLVLWYIQTALRKQPAAWRYFEGLAPSHRRRYIGWIESAKREETKGRRLQEAIRLLTAGKPLDSSKQRPDNRFQPSAAWRDEVVMVNRKTICQRFVRLRARHARDQGGPTDGGPDALRYDQGDVRVASRRTCPALSDTRLRSRR